VSQAQALHQAGLADAQAGRYDEALRKIEAAMALAPATPLLLEHRANLLAVLGRFEEALAGYNAVLAARPGDAGTLNNRGSALLNLGRAEEALADFDAALARQPGLADAWHNRGNALRRANRLEAALDAYDHALRLRPGNPDTLVQRGLVLTWLRRFGESLASYDAALAQAPGRIDALTGRADMLLALGAYRAALSDYDALLARVPDHPYALGNAAKAVMNLCDWPLRAAMEARLRGAITQNRVVIAPYMLLGYSDDKALQLAAARRAVAHAVQAGSVAMPPATGLHDKIRIAYLSSDYGQHPVPGLIARVIESHDRSRFDVLGISTGLDDGSALRARMTRAFDTFHDMQAATPRQLAEALRGLEADIVIDLNGHTEGDHFAALALRPAPLQVAWLGYPGTTGATFIDYVLGDAIVTPFADQAFFAEQIVQLPDCYFPTSYAPLPAPPSRAEAGLPQAGFVFGCFSNSWKITQPVFDSWMRLLAQVDGSVLWLLDANADAKTNLRRHAQAANIDPARLVFAPRVASQANLARLALADLMLDTQPYPGHMTASDALWAGVPLVTMVGQAFAARAAASIVTAAGLPELVTQNLAAYEALAIAVARDPARLAALHARLVASRATAPLFDTGRLTRHVEDAYITMMARQRAGQPPQGFAVTPRG